MKVADNLKCKDFHMKWEWKRGNLKGQENYGEYRIYYKDGRYIGSAHTKEEARRFISGKVKLVNNILKKAREENK